MLNIDQITEPYRTRLRRYLEKLLEMENLKAVVLFGSIAEDKAKPFPESDIDLLVIADNLPENPVERRMKLLPLKDEDTIIEDIWLTPRELEESIEGGWGVILDALTFGKTLHDPYNIIKTATAKIQQHYTRIGRVWKRKNIKEQNK